MRVSIPRPFCPPGTRVSSPPRRAQGGHRKERGLSNDCPAPGPGSALCAHSVWCPPHTPEPPLSPSPFCRRRQGRSAKRTELPRVIREEKAELGFEPGSAGSPGNLQGLSWRRTGQLNAYPFGLGRWVLPFSKNPGSRCPFRMEPGSGTTRWGIDSTWPGNLELALGIPTADHSGETEAAHPLRSLESWSWSALSVALLALNASPLPMHERGGALAFGGRRRMWAAAPALSRYLHSLGLARCKAAALPALEALTSEQGKLRGYREDMQGGGGGGGGCAMRTSLSGPCVLNRCVSQGVPPRGPVLPLSAWLPRSL